MQNHFFQVLLLIRFQHQYIVESVYLLIFLLIEMKNNILYSNINPLSYFDPRNNLDMLFIVVKCVFSITSLVSMSLILSLIINSSTKCFLFDAYGDTLTSLITIPSLVFSLLLWSYSILWNPPCSKIVIEIWGLSFSNCSISLVNGRRLMLSIFSRSQHFNIFLNILSRFLLPS